MSSQQYKIINFLNFQISQKGERMHEDNRKITKYPVWTHLKKEKNLYVKNIYHNPRGGTRLIFLAHAKGFQSTLQRPKKKKCSSLFNDKIKWTQPINYAGVYNVTKTHIALLVGKYPLLQYYSHTTAWLTCRLQIETPEHIRRLTKQWSLDFATYIVCVCSKVRSL